MLRAYLQGYSISAPQIKLIKEYFVHSENVILDSLRCMKENNVPCLLMVTHALGGGVERHVQELQAVLENKAHVIVIRPHVHAQQIVLTIPLYVIVDGVLQAHEPLKLAFKWRQDSAQLLEWLDLLGISRVHVHHVLGFPNAFWDSILKLQIPLDLTLHDHSIFTGNPSLLNEQGYFNPNWLEENLAALPPGDLQIAQTLQNLALHAQRVIVPSKALAAVVNKMLPNLNVLVRNHPEREVDGRYPAVQLVKSNVSKPFKVLCLGMLGIEKGAYALAHTAALAAKQQCDIEFILLGSCHITLPDSVRCMGLYQDADLLSLIVDIDPHLLWLPAQCPETWSYTLSAGLRLGLPVLASDLGALPERLIGRPLTQLLTHTASAEQWLSAIQQFHGYSLTEQDSVTLEWVQTDKKYFYTASPSESDVHESSTSFYLVSSCIKTSNIDFLPIDFLQAQQLAMQSMERWRVVLLRVVYTVSRWPIVRGLVNSIPYYWQRRLKRAISFAPLDSTILRK